MNEKNLDSDSITILNNDYLNFVIKHSTNKYLYNNYVEDNIKHGLDFFGINQEIFYNVNMTNFNYIKTVNSINSVQGDIPLRAKEFIASKLDIGVFLRHTDSFGNYRDNVQMDENLLKKTKLKNKVKKSKI